MSAACQLLGTFTVVHRRRRSSANADVTPTATNTPTRTERLWELHQHKQDKAASIRMYPVHDVSCLFFLTHTHTHAQVQCPPQHIMHTQKRKDAHMDVSSADRDVVADATDVMWQPTVSCFEVLLGTPPRFVCVCVCWTPNKPALNAEAQRFSDVFVEER